MIDILIDLVSNLIGGPNFPKLIPQWNSLSFVIFDLQVLRGFCWPHLAYMQNKSGKKCQFKGPKNFFGEPYSAPFKKEIEIVLEKFETNEGP